MIPELRTERLVMRGWREDDFPALAAFYGDAEISRFVGGPAAPADAWRRLAAFVGHWSLRGYGFWLLEEAASGAAVGYCGLWFPHGWDEQEIGWCLFRGRHGRGYATEAARRARRHAYEDLGWTTAVSYIAFDNHPSIAVAERLGAVRDGTTEIRGTPVGVWRHPAPGQH